MANVEIIDMSTTLEFEPEVITARAPAAAEGGGTAAGGTASDMMRAREILRPLIVELLEEELTHYTRTRG